MAQFRPATRGSVVHGLGWSDGERTLFLRGSSRPADGRPGARLVPCGGGRARLPVRPAAGPLP